MHSSFEVQVKPFFFTHCPGVEDVESAQYEPVGHVASVQHTDLVTPLGVQWPLEH
jgi:hypothetical protein